MLLDPSLYLYLVGVTGRWGARVALGVDVELGGDLWLECVEACCGAPYCYGHAWDVVVVVTWDVRTRDYREVSGVLRSAVQVLVD